MKLFKKKMGGIRFRVDSGMNISSEADICLSLASQAFSAIEGDAELSDSCSVSGFTTADNPFDGDLFIPSAVMQGTVLCAAFRRDTRGVSASSVDREYMRQTGGDPVKNKDARKALKAEIKAALLQKTPFKTAIVPFFFDLEAREGVFFSTSKTAFLDFQLAFTSVIGADLIRVDFAGHDIADDSMPREFLTWLWWKSETDSMSEPAPLRVEVTGKATAESEDKEQSLSGKMSFEETKLAVSEGCEVSQMGLSTTEGDFIVSRSGTISGLEFEDDELPTKDSGSWLPVVHKTAQVFSLMDKWFEKFESFDMKVYENGKQNWIRPSICTRMIEEI